MADLKLPSINRIQISGRITQDIELKYTPKGTPVAKFSVAVDENYKDTNDQWQKSTTFFNCVAWSKVAEQVNTQARKGTAVLLEGKMTSRKYEQDGVSKTAWEINVFSFNALEWLPKADDGTQPTQQTPPAPRQPVANDDVPF